MTEGKFTEAKNKKLAYAGEFKDFVRENPGILKSVLGLIDKVDKKGDLERGVLGEIGEIEVEPIYNHGRRRRAGYLVAVGNDKFFLKKVNAAEEELYIARGFDEALSTKAAKDILKDMPGVRVVNFQLGYQDNENSYFVSRWEGSPHIVELFRDFLNNKLWYEKIYGAGSLTAEKEKELQRLRNRVRYRMKKVESLFDERGYFEVVSDNMLYDLDKDQIILLDLFYER